MCDTLFFRCYAMHQKYNRHYRINIVIIIIYYCWNAFVRKQSTFPLLPSYVRRRQTITYDFLYSPSPLTIQLWLCSSLTSLSFAFPLFLLYFVLVYAATAEKLNYKFSKSFFSLFLLFIYNFRNLFIICTLDL